LWACSGIKRKGIGTNVPINVRSEMLCCRNNGYIYSSIKWLHLKVSDRYFFARDAQDVLHHFLHMPEHDVWLAHSFVNTKITTDHLASICDLMFITTFVLLFYSATRARNFKTYLWLTLYVMYRYIIYLYYRCIINIIIILNYYIHF